MSSIKILIADDDASIRLVLSQAFSRLGYQVRATGNATYVFNTCKPTCVAGTDKTKAVTFVLKDAQLVNGRELFSKIVLKYGTHTRHYSLPTSTI